MMTEIEKRLHDYWERRGVDYYVPDVFGRRIVAAYLVKIHPQSLVDVGCGSGELFSGFQKIPRVVGLDWSSEMLKRANERIARHGYINIATQQLDITKEAYPMKFEVALTRTVLMHIPEPSLTDACKNLAKMSDHLVLMEYFNPTEDVKLDWHNFHHDYVGLFRGLDYELIDSYDRPDGIHQILFHFQRKTT